MQKRSTSGEMPIYPKIPKFKVVALSSPLAASVRDLAAMYLSKKSVKCEIVNDPSHNYGSDKDLFAVDSIKDRLKALYQSFKAPDCDGVWASRGGYSVFELLSEIDYSKLEVQGRPFIGFSDSTFLHVALYKKLSGVTLHGPNFSSFGGDLPEAIKEENLASLLRCLNLHIGLELYPTGAHRFLSNTKTNEQVEGTLIGGNLSALASLCGTAWFPDTFKDHILFFEECGEEPYRVHRMLMQLREFGVFSSKRGVSGVVIGQLEGCLHKRGAAPTVSRVVEDFFSQYTFPVAIGAPFGHGKVNYTIPVGARAALTSNRLVLL